MLQGRIVKGIAGFYYVDAAEGDDVTRSGVYVCKAKGIFRENGIKPIPGDYVCLEVIDEEKMEATIVEVLPRKNELIRPEVANVDQVLILFAIKKPNPNFLLLDRYLVMMQKNHLPVLLCFNKQDIASKEEEASLYARYKDSGCALHVISVHDQRGMDELRQALKNKTTVLAGPSGVGKSTLTNALMPHAKTQVGELSVKLGRGKNTTRHTMLYGENQTYLIDTPGFTALSLNEILPEMLHTYYPEFSPFIPQCRFRGCIHDAEPDCAVKQAVRDGRISRERYENYRMLLREITGTREVFIKKKKGV